MNCQLNPILKPMKKNSNYIILKITMFAQAHLDEYNKGIEMEAGRQCKFWLPELMDL
jgi:hypothetical protein